MNRFVLLSVALFSAPKAPFTRHDKAYYLDAAKANFIRPGLAITIISVITLFVVMQVTGRIRWSEKFDKLGVAPLATK